MHLTFNFQNNFFSMKDKKAFIKFHYTLVLFFCLPACTILFQYLMMNEKLFFFVLFIKNEIWTKKVRVKQHEGPSLQHCSTKAVYTFKGIFSFLFFFLSLYFSFVIFYYLSPCVFFGFCPFFCLTLHLYLFKSSTNEALYLSLSLFHHLSPEFSYLWSYLTTFFFSHFFLMLASH
jgi:hypothetical protein